MRFTDNLKKKYIDKPNHVKQTLILKRYNSRITEVDAPLMVNRLYDTLKVGDEIFKKKGSALLTIERGSLKIELTIDKSNWCSEELQSEKN